MVATRLAEGTPLSCRPGFSRLDGHLVEMMVLLPQEQAAALEAAANGEGVTVGQLVRRLVRDFTGQDWPGGAEEEPPDRWIG